MKKRKFWVIFSLFAGLLSLVTGCLDESTQGDLQQLSFSRDTVFFDTVFTTLGTSTESLKLYNKGTQTLRIKRIRLEQGTVFRFNADGTPGPEVENLDILPGDSAFVFIEATLNPNQGNGILIHEEKLVFESMSDSREVVLAVPGTDAIFYLPTDTLASGAGGLPYSILPCATTWKAGKPIVVVGYLVVDSLCQLTIEAGAQIYFYRNGALWIYRGGNLQVNGEQNAKVVFQGTRLGANFEELPGQWDRILINDGGTARFRHALIKNAFIGLQADHLGRLAGQDGPGEVLLQSVEIRNCSGLGLFSRGHRINAFNLLIHNCGQYAAALTYGGNYRFYHTTLANYWSRSNRQTPTLFLNNFSINGNSAIGWPMDFSMVNSLVYGSLEKEFTYDSIPDVPLQFQFERCALRVAPNFPLSPASRYIHVWKNINPQFEQPSLGQFILKSNSPLLDSASTQSIQTFPFQLTFDIYGKNRTFSQPDPGAMER